MPSRNSSKIDYLKIVFISKKILMGVLSLGYLTSCGSSKDEDLQAMQNDKKSADKETSLDAITSKTNAKPQKNPIPETSVSLNPENCQFPLYAGSQPSTEESRQPQLILAGQIDTTCANAETLNFSFTSNLPVTILHPGVRCRTSDKTAETITCTGKTAGIVQEGNFKLPILVGGNAEEWDVTASVQFYAADK